jgi:hypothetical protein
VNRLLQAAANLAGKQQRRASRRARRVAKAAAEGLRTVVRAPHRWYKHARNHVPRAYATWKRQTLVDLKHFSARQLAPGRPAEAAAPATGWDLQDARDVRELLTLLGRSDKAILVGPWLSETGFELLYWIPFLSWAKAYGNLAADRLVVISRGGAAPWYAHLTTNYEDVLSYFTPEEFRRRNEERIAGQEGRLKHLEVSSFDREIVARVSAKRRIAGAELLHPSEMYRLFEHFWFQRAPVSLVEAFTAFSPLPPTAPFTRRSELPARYVAAKFYGNSALPDTPENRAFAAGFLADLARHVDVVLLNTSDRYDDHDDFPPQVRGRLHRIEHLMKPDDNLAVQTQVIRHAEAFVGTYGGFSYLAPLAGVDTLAFYSHPTAFRFDHLEVAKRVFSALRCGAFVEMETRAAAMMKLGFGSLRPVVGAT